jgi:hypothetical protein
MVSSSKMEIEKFNGKIFELWKLKMEDLLVEEISGSWWIQVLHLQELQQMTGKSWIEGEEHNLTVSLRFSITECVRGSYNQGFMG